VRDPRSAQRPRASFANAIPAVTIRPARASDRGELVVLRRALWPDGTIEEHDRDLERIFAASFSPLPYAILLADDEGIGGFIEVSLRSHADGCETSPIGFIEGWYVIEPWRRRGYGALLLRAAEDWSRAQGCREIASDALIENAESQRAHEALGFEVVDRCVHYRKAL